MAQIIGFDPITGDAIWDDESMNTPVPEPLPTHSNQPIITTPDVTYNTAVYMVSGGEQPDPELLPDIALPEGETLELDDAELWEVLDTARWYREYQLVAPNTVAVLLVIDDAAERDSPIYSVDFTTVPITLSALRK